MRNFTNAPSTTSGSPRSPYTHCHWEKKDSQKPISTQPAPKSMVWACKIYSASMSWNSTRDGKTLRGVTRGTWTGTVIGGLRELCSFIVIRKTRMIGLLSRQDLVFCRLRRLGYRFLCAMPGGDDCFENIRAMAPEMWMKRRGGTWARPIYQFHNQFQRIDYSVQ